MSSSIRSKAGANASFLEAASPLLVSFVGTIIALFPANPNNVTLPSRDSGVFLYVGWRLLNGDMPYLRVWDHKPPLIYFVDALGLSLSPNTLWGVWLLQFVFIFFTLFFVYRLLHQEFGIYAALAGTVVLTSGFLTILEKGNVTEEYALLLQVMAFWLFLKAWKRDFPIRDSFWLGVIGGLAFNFKQTTIGIWITYAVVLLVVRLFQRKFPLRDSLAMLAGWLLPSLILAGWLASRNALSDFWEQAFLYNFAYIGKHEGIRKLIPVFVKGFSYLRNGWVLYLAVLGWLMGASFAWANRKDVFAENNRLILIALVNLPIEVILITISGRSILHYYLTPLPVMAILAGSLVYTVHFLVGKIATASSQRMTRLVPSLVLAIVLIGQLGQIQLYPEHLRQLSDNDSAPVVEYIVRNTKPDDKVLIIGAESAVNFLARREAPTRYVYQYPLALLGRRPMFEEYFNEILADKPVLIVDTRGRARLDEKLYEPLQKRSQIVRDGVRYLGENYQPVAQFENWIVYRLSGN